MPSRIPGGQFHLLLSAAVGGGLMGLANLVPGVSGGTMLLAAGIYPRCIEAIAKVTTLRLDREAVGLLAAVSVSAGLVVLLLAGTVKGLVLEHRWVMYSIFLGSTLGGVPVLWKLIGGPDWRSWLGAVGGLALMAATRLVPDGADAAQASQIPILFLAGLGAFAAMLLPGLSGSYLLLLSGQYVPVLGAVDGIKEALVGGAGSQASAVLTSASVLAPFATGCLAALVGVSSLIRFLLHRYRSPMLGFLLGLLAGAVLGLWPFENDASALVVPSSGQAAAAASLAIAGFCVTLGVARLAPAEKEPRNP